MALTDLLKAGKHQLEGDCQALDIITHPGWSVPFDTSWKPRNNEPPLLGMGRAAIHDSLDLIERNIQRGSLPFGRAEKKPLLRKTIRCLDRGSYSFAKGFAQLHRLTGQLIEADSLIPLGKAPYVLVLPSLASSCIKPSYRAFLEWIGTHSPNGYYVESDTINTGYLSQEKERQPGYILGRDPPPEKISRITSLAEAVGADSIRLWGGYVNQCLFHTETEIHSSGMPYEVDLHRSQLSRWMLEGAYTGLIQGSEFLTLLDDCRREAVFRCVESLLGSPPDMSGLRHSGSGSWREMLEGFRRMPGWLEHIIDIQTAVAYKHHHRAYKSIAA